MNHIIFYIAWIIGMRVLVECFTGNSFFHTVVALLAVAALAFITHQHFNFLEDDKEGDCRDY